MPVYPVIKTKCNKKNWHTFLIRFVLSTYRERGSEAYRNIPKFTEVYRNSRYLTVSTRKLTVSNQKFTTRNRRLTVSNRKFNVRNRMLTVSNRNIIMRNRKFTVSNRKFTEAHQEAHGSSRNLTEKLTEVHGNIRNPIPIGNFDRDGIFSLTDYNFSHQIGVAVV